MNRILALDLSLTNAGVCRLLSWQAGMPLFETETVTVEPLRVPGARPGKTKAAPRVGTDRLAWWRRWICQELQTGDYQLVVMEAPSMGSMGHSFDKGELYGVVKIACYDRDVRLVQIPPTSLKLYGTGHGASDKQRMIDMAVCCFGTQIKDEHQADAAWLCRMAAQSDTLDWPFHAEEYEMRALAALRNKGIL